MGERHTPWPTHEAMWRLHLLASPRISRFVALFVSSFRFRFSFIFVILALGLGGGESGMRGGAKRREGREGARKDGERRGDVQGQGNVTTWSCHLSCSFQTTGYAGFNSRIGQHALQCSPTAKEESPPATIRRPTRHTPPSGFQALQLPLVSSAKVDGQKVWWGQGEGRDGACMCGCVVWVCGVGVWCGCVVWVCGVGG